MVDRLPYDDNGHRTMLHDAKCGTGRHIHGLGGERIGMTIIGITIPCFDIPV